MTASNFASMGTKEVKSFTFNSAASTITLVDVVPNKKIMLLSLVLSSDDAVELAFKSDTTIIGPVEILTSPPPLVLPNNQDGWFITKPNEALKLSQNGSVTLMGFGRYVEV